MVKFTKMEGIGNDYVYVDVQRNMIKNPAKFAKKVSDRHFGIGSDGLILIDKSAVADFKMNIYNTDGSEAEMCGNGIRCVGKFVYDKGLTKKTIFTVETLAGVKTLELTLKDGRVDLVKVDMGIPIFEADEIPVLNALGYEFANIKFVKTKVKSFNNKSTDFTCISMGNPHAVCFLSDIDGIDISKVGFNIENDANFPKRTNVEFIKIINRNEIQMRVWERGVGETMACGTGACASALASFLNGFTDRFVQVDLLGGKLYIEWKDDNHVYLTGPASIVFDGEIDE